MHRRRHTMIPNRVLQNTENLPQPSRVLFAKQLPPRFFCSSLSLFVKFQMHLKMRRRRKLNFRMSCPSFGSVWITHICLTVRQCPFFSALLFLSFYGQPHRKVLKKICLYLLSIFPHFLLLIFYVDYLMYCSYSDFFSFKRPLLLFLLSF